jgi:hypothetical protein
MLKILTFAISRKRTTSLREKIISEVARNRAITISIIRDRIEIIILKRIVNLIRN